jgi:hypothetical protein
MLNKKPIMIFFLIMSVFFNCNNQIVTGKYGGYIIDTSTDLVIANCKVKHETDSKYTDINGYFEYEVKYSLTPGGANTSRSIIIEASKTGYITNYFELFEGNLDSRYKLTPQ